MKTNSNTSKIDWAADPTNTGSLLVAQRYASPDDISDASSEQRAHGGHLGTQLLNLFKVSPTELINTLLWQDKLRGKKSNVVAMARSVANSTSLHHFRLQQKHEQVRAAADAIGRR